MTGNRVEADRAAERGEACFRAGDIYGTLTHYQQALALHEKVNPAGVEVAWCLDRVGAAQFRLGRIDDATRTLQRAVALRRALHMPVHLAEALTSLALCRLGTEQFAAAHAALHEALDTVRRHRPNSLIEGQILTHLAMISADHGDPTAAMAQLRAGLDIMAAIDPMSRDTAITLGKMGTVARQTGDLDEAVEMHEAAVAISRRGPWPKDLADTLANLAVALLDAGRVDEALQCLFEAQDIYERVAPESRTYGGCLRTLGIAYELVGDSARAAACFDRSVAIRDPA
ncbi:tetratricopeptide repeat protein [Jidongwangia harbinensis]|uniref:tetratricopeptide repeat protein n=1 Tax=Jidongwangia harbinensis TaxID=2878561 RepID=UPI001CD9AFA1|nr:tetratricopeptide repeat protein [Jidongwangia harbinensis]MCA2211645.1 tetratricopeptide repeat protein [Jidongwangia harbinensis]